MLSTLRKGTTTWIAKLFIGVLILSFAVWGVSGLVLSSSNQTLAEVGDIEITQQDYQRLLPSIINEWNTRLKQRLTSQQLRAFDIPSQVKTRLINQAALDNHIDELELGVSDAEIGNSIQQDPQLKDQTGRFNKELLKQILQSERISEKRYFSEQRKSALRAQITSLFSQKKMVPEILLKSLYHHREDKREVEYFVIPNKAVKKAKAPTDDQLKSYYESSKSTYIAPEYRKVELLVLSIKELAKTTKVSEDNLKKTYELRKKNYITPASRSYFQMTFDSMEKAIEAHKALKAGKKIEEIAKKFGKGGKAEEIGPVTEAQMVDPKLAKAVFTLKKGEFTAPIEGTFAITIAKVSKSSKEIIKSFKDARTELLAQLQERAARKNINSLYERIEDLRGSGMEVAKVAQEIGMQSLTINAVDNEGKGIDGKENKDIPSTTKLLSAIFGADIGDDTVAVRHRDGGFVWFDVLEIKPKRTKSFDEVKTAVTKAWKLQENKKIAARFAADTTKKIKDGAKFAKVAKSLRAKINKPKKFGRGTVVDDLPPFLVNKLFGLKVGSIESGLDSKNKNWVIVKVTKLLPAKEDSDSFNAYKQTLTRELQSEVTNDFFSQYVAGVKAHYGVKEYSEVFKQLKSSF